MMSTKGGQRSLRPSMPLLLLIFFSSALSHALVDEYGRGNRDGLVALYLFDETQGTIIRDQSGFQTPLNLVIKNTTTDGKPRYLWLGSKGLALGLVPAPSGGIPIAGMGLFSLAKAQSFDDIRGVLANETSTNYLPDQRVTIVSESPADKIINACRQSEAVTVQVITRNYVNSNRNGTMFSIGRVQTPRVSATPNTTTIPGTTLYSMGFNYDNAMNYIFLNQNYSNNSLNSGATIYRALNGTLNTGAVQSLPNFVTNTSFTSAEAFSKTGKQEYIVSLSKNGDINYYIDRIRHKKLFTTITNKAKTNLSDAWATPPTTANSLSSYLTLGNRIYNDSFDASQLANTKTVMQQVDSSITLLYNQKISADNTTWMRTPNLLGGTSNATYRPGFDDNGDLRATEVLNLISQAGWSGEYHLVAVYCKDMSPEDILGKAAPEINQRSFTRPQMNGDISEQRKYAKRVFEKLTATKIPIDSTLLDDMEKLITSGDKLGAAEIATRQPGFLNLRVKEMALKMSNREESSRVQLNDFAATFMGVTRDQSDARELLYGDFFYMADPAKASVPSNLVNDLLRSNRHNEFLGSGEFDIGASLKRMDGQVTLASDLLSTTKHPDPAGVITSRAFLGAHAIAGTNRRPVEFLFREFMCTPLENWADTTAPDTYIGGDVDRFPAGSHEKYLNTCKGCHSVMDGFRGAFAKVDYRTTYTLHTDIVKESSKIPQDSNGVVLKYNANNSIYPAGKVVTNDSFVNNAVSKKNMDFFGWRGESIYGHGIQQLGKMVANSKRFSLCMAKRIYESTCQRQVSDSDLATWMKKYSDQFEADNYNLKKLFQRIAVSDECFGGGK